MAKINDTTTYPNTTPVLTDHVPGTDVSDTTNDANGETVTFTLQAVMDLFEANMSVDLANFTITGSAAEFDAALQSDTFLFNSELGSVVQAYDADTLKADIADQLTAGFTAATDDDGAAASPYTPDPDTGNYKRVTNDGAMTINPPTMASGESASIILLITNTTGAGAITWGGTVQKGDSFTTTTTDEFLCSITAVDVGGTTYSVLNVIALQ